MIVIERLRALENKWRDELPYKGSAWEERHDIIEECADELAILIAELGQEVGAVAPVSFAVELADGTLGALGWIDYAKFEHVKNMGTLANGARYVFAYRTSPAHTSEARDAARYRALKTHFQAKFHRATCDYWVIVGELKTDPRFIGEDGEQLTLDNALDAAIAAMRQEGGSDA